ncbi:TetR/AcrR family transcriptional regulator [Roseomonas gilardii]|uniref:TetR/AcrR family transcriptional regulator n=1 Tax=Roseomonas gilardii TaxID=257708 RepID=UPI00047F5B7F|nr:TetR/AcrR family transcriptional regulator [Roseomonas gilardii]SUE42732.1 HTH-type transcriptional repressor KstR2 [Roseomonas gilardii subsp. rosea]
MARIAGSNGPRTAALIREVGLTLIHEHGFEAMSLRDLAAEVGIQPASLYNHIASKQELLFDLVREHMEALLASTAAALDDAPPDPLRQLRAFVAHHLLYHMDKKREVYVANFELRALEPRNRDAILALRRLYEGRLIALLDDGVAAGEFALADTRVAAYAMLAMLTGVCTWYRPDGRLVPEEVVRLHTELVLAGCRGREMALPS